MEPWERSLRAYLAGQDDLAAAYLFGSRARGDARPASDVDIAAVFADRRAPDPLERAVRRGLMIDELQGCLRLPVDVVDFDGVDPRMALAILRDGRVVLDRAPERRHVAALRQLGLYDDRRSWYADERRRTMEFFGVDAAADRPPTAGSAGGEVTGGA